MNDKVLRKIIYLFKIITIKRYIIMGNTLCPSTKTPKPLPPAGPRPKLLPKPAPAPLNPIMNPPSQIKP
jgi:hypothetical protein